MRNEKVIYTVLVGDYEELIEPDVVTPGWDYICFTDSDRHRSNVWQMRQISIEESIVLTTRKPKILFHQHMDPCHNVCVYIDGNIRIGCDLNEFIKFALPDNCDMATLKHPGWNCTYQEADAIIRAQKAPEEDVQRQIAGYIQEGLPQNFGMIAAYLLVYRNHNVNLQRHCEHWYAELADPTKINRDQISFNYLVWKHGLIEYNPMIITEVMGVYFHWLPHSK